ncbi:MAG: ribosomal subunit interface protein [Chloroflexi bacterium GWB2_49_20]|nr:MAG: ribosomal subunit interface protein [Chloroflexi bacterium GWB2_49_20]OGN78216.1 MAG: ribosomal subunit interface protein [Chloroflexi bacterium GWC2_49_37]OGN85252.1 MAG: ribosomal subunit interface protein [Chloroflexi bacterium GWD2_49_16]
MAFELEITARNMEVTERIRNYINKKVSKLDRHFDEIDEIKVDLVYAKSVRSSTDRNVAQITARGRGFMLRSEERADEIFAAFDIALEKMQRQVERYKGKRQKARGDGRSVSEVVLEKESVEPEEIAVIARRKEFDLVPMSEDEALEQMKLLAHDNFFIFFNVGKNVINVLYRRRDGSYGLIEPIVRQ